VEKIFIDLRKMKLSPVLWMNILNRRLNWLVSLLI